MFARDSGAGGAGSAMARDFLRCRDGGRGRSGGQDPVQEAAAHGDLRPIVRHIRVRCGGRERDGGP